MTDTNTREKKSIDIPELVNSETLQWIAAIPLTVLAVIPLFVFLFRLQNNGYYGMGTFLDPTRGIFCIIAGITAMCCIVVALKEKQAVSAIIGGNRPFIFFAAFMLMMLISYLAVGIPEFDDPFNELGIYPNEGHIMYIMFFTVYFFLGSRIRSARVKALVIRSNVAVSFFLAFFGLIDFYIVPVFPLRFTEMWDGCFPAVWNNPNHYGYYLTIMTLLSVGMFLYEKERGWRIAGLVSSVVHCVVTELNDTFGSYLAVWFGFIFIIAAHLIIYRKFPVKLLIPAAVLLLASLFLATWQGTMTDNFVNLGSDTTNIVSDSEAAQFAGSSRWALWMAALDGIKDSPVFGQGVEGWDDILLARSTTGIHAHNEYLQYALFFGIPALCCYVAGIIAVFLRGLFNRKKLDGFTLMSLAAAFGYCVSAFFGNPKYYTAPYFFVILGLAYNYCTGGEEKSTGTAKSAETDAHESLANS